MENQSTHVSHQLYVGHDADKEFSKLFAHFLESSATCSISGIERQGRGNPSMSSFTVISGAIDNFPELLAGAKDKFKMLILDEGELSSDGWKATYYPGEQILSILSSDHSIH